MEKGELRESQREKGLTNTWPKIFQRFRRDFLRTSDY